MEARGVMEHHRRRRHAQQVSVFSFDYLFLDSEGKKCENSQDLEKVVATVLVAHDSMSGCDFAHIVPQKGVDNDQYSVDVLVEDIKWLGFIRIILKSDNEPAIVKLLSDTLRELRYSTTWSKQPRSIRTHTTPAGTPTWRRRSSA